MGKENEHIDPLQDIDFEALGVMVKPDDDPRPASEQKEDPPDTPPATGSKSDPSDEDLAKSKPDDDDPDTGDDPDPDDDPEAGDDPPETDDPPKDPPEVEEESTLVSELIELVGYEDLDPEQYEDSVEGLGKLIQDSAQKLGAQQWDAMLAQLPEVKEFYDYVVNGGDPEAYHTVRGQAKDYDQIEIDEKDEAQQERLVRDALSLNDHEKEEIDNIVEKYKAGGILKDQAELALRGLKRYTTKQKAELTERQTKLAEEQKQKVQEFWTGVKTTIKDQDEFRGIRIPKKEKDPFYDYISKPVKDGYTQRDLDALEMGLEEKIAVDYLLFKKLDLSGLIDKRATTKNAASLRERIKSGPGQKPRKGAHPKPPGEKGEVKVDNLDLI